MSESVKLGKVSMTLGGDYSSSQAYDKLTCVQYDGRSWVSRKQVPAGVAPTEANSAYWQKISDRGVQGPQGQSYVDKELVPIVNDLTTGGSSNVLSAEQGKVLDGKVAKLSEEAIKNMILSEAFCVNDATYKDGMIVTPVNVTWANGGAGSIHSITRNADDLITKMVVIVGEKTYTLNISRDINGNVINSEIS